MSLILERWEVRRRDRRGRLAIFAKNGPKSPAGIEYPIVEAGGTSLLPEKDKREVLEHIVEMHNRRLRDQQLTEKVNRFLLRDVNEWKL